LPGSSGQPDQLPHVIALLSSDAPDIPVNPVPILLTSWLGEENASGARRIFSEQRIPCYSTPTVAVRVLMHMVRYQKNQQMLTETAPNIPEAFSPDVEGSMKVIEDALAEGRQWLSDSETRAVLSGCSIATGACLTFTTRRFTTNREHPIQIWRSRGLSVIMPSVQVHRPRQKADSRDSGRRRNGKDLDRGR